MSALGYTSRLLDGTVPTASLQAAVRQAARQTEATDETLAYGSSNPPTVGSRESLTLQYHLSASTKLARLESRLWLCANFSV